MEPIFPGSISGAVCVPIPVVARAPCGLHFMAPCPCLVAPAELCSQGIWPSVSPALEATCAAAKQAVSAHVVRDQHWGAGEGMGVGWPDSARCPPKCCATASGPLTWWGWTAHCPGVTEGEPRPALRGGSLWSWGVLDSVNVVSLLRCSGAPCPGLPPAPPNPAKSPAPSKLPSLFLALPLSYCHLCSSVKWSQESVQVDVSSGMSFHKQDTPMTPAQVE